MAEHGTVGRLLLAGRNRNQDPGWMFEKGHRAQFHARAGVEWSGAGQVPIAKPRHPEPVLDDGVVRRQRYAAHSNIDRRPFSGIRLAWDN